jgi:hypothetical protein
MFPWDTSVQEAGPSISSALIEGRIWEYGVRPWFDSAARGGEVWAFAAIAIYDDVGSGYDEPVQHACGRVQAYTGDYDYRALGGPLDQAVPVHRDTFVHMRAFLSYEPPFPREPYDTTLYLSVGPGEFDNYQTVVPTATRVGPGMSLISETFSPPQFDPDPPGGDPWRELAYLGVTLVNMRVARLLQEQFEGIRELLAQRPGG